MEAIRHAPDQNKETELRDRFQRLLFGAPRRPVGSQLVHGIGWVDQDCRGVHSKGPYGPNRTHRHKDLSEHDFRKSPIIIVVLRIRTYDPNIVDQHGKSYPMSSV